MRFKIILFTLIISAVSGANAQYMRLTLEECIDTAFSNNASLKAAALEVEKARILRATAFDPPMTGITLKQETTGGGGPENGVAFTQDFDFPSVYTTSYRRLDALYRLEQSRFALEASALTRDITSAYYSLLYVDKLLWLNTELETLYTGFLDKARIRHQEGETSMLEVINAERILEQNRLERISIQMDKDSFAARLQALTGSESPISPVDTLHPLLPSLSEEYNFASSLRGDLVRDELTVAEKEIALEKNRFLPGIKLGATVQALIKGFNPYNVVRERFEPGNFMGFEVGITVPLFFGARRSRLKAANAEKTAILLRGEYAETSAVSEMKTMTATIGSLREKLDYMDRVSMPRANEMCRLAQVSYELGEIDYMEYIANMEAAFEIYKERALAVENYNQAVIKLEDLKR